MCKKKRHFLLTDVTRGYKYCDIAIAYRTRGKNWSLTQARTLTLTRCGCPTFILKTKIGSMADSAKIFIKNFSACRRHVESCTGLNQQAIDTIKEFGGDGIAFICSGCRCRVSQGQTPCIHEYLQYICETHSRVCFPCLELEIHH